MWTIGHGDTEYLKQFKDPQNRTITKEMAEFLLEERVGADYEFLKGLLTITLTINQIIALLSLMFNIGRGAFQGSTLLKKLNSGASLQEVEFEFMRWNKAKRQEPTVGVSQSKGLMVRRKREWEMFIQ